MKKKILCVLLLSALLLSGCGSILNREYTALQPHSFTYYEGSDRSVLRAENYQDVVNDLLVLVDDSAKEGVIWLYEGEEQLNAADTAERACREVKEETPLGAYAVDYLSYTVEETPRNYTEIHVTVGYRRTAEQMAAIVHATSVAALYDLLTAAAENDAPELTVQVSYFDAQEDDVREIVSRVQAERMPGLAELWQVNFYPEGGDGEIIEIIMKNQKEQG